MNGSREAITRYFMEALRLDRLVPIDQEEPRESAVLRDEVNKGELDDETTKRLFNSRSAKKLADDSPRKMRVVILLVSIYDKDTGKVSGLLNIPATLLETGKLEFDANRDRPWIPRNRLMMEHAEELDVMVGNLSDFWSVYRDQESEFEKRDEADSWVSYLDFADAVYKRVASGVAKQAVDAGYEYCDAVCYVEPYDGIDANAPVIELYNTILRSDANIPLYNQMIGQSHRGGLRDSCASNESFVDDVLQNALETSGSMNCAFSPKASQRRAIHAYQAIKEGEVLAVGGPPGTGKTTMLQAIVATAIVQRALEGKDAPIIVGTSTNNQAVTNIVDSFSKVVPEEHGVLDFRWLPEIPKEEASEDGNDAASGGEGAKCEVDQGKAAGDKTLSSIVAFCPAKSRLDEYASKYLCEQRDKSGIYTAYSGKEYAAAAKEKLLDYAESAGFEAASLGSLKKDLLKCLRRVDEARRSALRDYHAYLSFLRDVDGCDIQDGKDRRTSLKKEWEIKKSHLSRWLQMDSERSLRTHIFDWMDRCFGGRRRGRAFVAINEEADESLPPSVSSLGDVIEHYNDELSRINGAYQEVDEKIEEYEQERERVRSCFTDSFERVRSIWEKADCANEEEFELEDADVPVLSDAELTARFLVLDEKLDITVRYIEFWLAVHYYECGWLEVCAEGEIIDEGERWQTDPVIQKRYWAQAPMLTPCFVMTAYQLPKYFGFFEAGEKGADFGRIDLLIVDEAGQVNIPVALASFALAKKAVVVGDVRQLPPIWAFGQKADMACAKSKGISEEAWKSQSRIGLACSPSSSLMKAATFACAWKTAEGESDLFLKEHFRCVDGIIAFCNDLIYQGSLELCRGRSSKLSEVGCKHPLLFKVVEDSRDERVGSSRRNMQEADAIVNWITENRAWLEELYGKDIKEIVGVVTPFRSQAELIKKKTRLRDPQLVGEKGMTIGTAHSLQGAERAVVLFSLVYGNNSGSASFVDENPELMNVAVSRAKDLFIVFGAERRRGDKGKVLRVLNRYAQDSDASFGRVKTSDDGGESCLRDEDIPGYEGVWVDQSEEGYESIGRFMAGLFGEGLLRKRVDAKEANRILQAAGLLQKVDYEPMGRSFWFPTARGFGRGIRMVSVGEGAAGYVNPQYSAACRDTVAEAINHASCDS